MSDFDQITPEDQPGLPGPVRWRVLASWASLGAERLWPILWPASGVVGLFLILALANVFAYLPEWLHLISLILFAAGIAAAAWWSLRQTEVPTRSQAVRHLEQSSGLTHRPLSTLEDKPATGTDDDTGRLWHAHRRWVLNHLHRLKVAWPKLTLAARDPHALRVLIVLVVAALAIANWSEVPARLAAAVSPGWAQGNVPATFEAWVTPPPYTGEAPRHLTSAAPSSGPDDSIAVPHGSTLTVRTHGDASAILRVGALGSSMPAQTRPEFLQAGGDARDAKLPIDTDMTVRLSLNASQAALWRFTVVADKPPLIAFKSPVTVTAAQTLRLHYAVKDDYGVVAAEAQIALNYSSPQNRQPPKPIVFDLPLPPAPARSGDSAIFKDLTAHVWAGLPVKVTLVARDEAGQAARSTEVKLVLPERRFNEALARALIEQRRSLARDPSSAPLVAKALDALSIAPERFVPDRRNYLALRTAYFMAQRYSPRNAGAAGQIDDLQQLLWDLALRVEDGDTPQAQAELRAIQQKLMEALARGAPDEEIEKLLAQLRSAIERAVKAMAERAHGQPSFAQGANGQTIRPQDLQSMLQQIQDLSRQGSRAAAQQMLSQLQNMLENLQPMGGGKMSPEQKAATEALEKLGSMIAQQRGLMDKTFREREANKSTPAKIGKPSPLKGEQEKLSDELTPVMKKAAQNEEIANALRRAQDAMDQAADDLGNGKHGAAGEAQQKAIDELRKGGEAAAKQLLQQMDPRGATMAGPGGMSAGEDEDPFGRPQSSFGPSSGDNVKVPDKLNIQKAREILEELQRRAAERGRPVNELEYIDRLLRRF
ncbi:MAG: TIGR02302 family protein [Micropepsaceae bacterium]